MADRAAPTDETEHPIEVNFDVLGNATRLQILNALFEVVSPSADDQTLTFSELYDRVEYDSSANFSYHLNQLVDAGLITQSDAGYALRLPGTMMIRQLHAGWTFSSDGPRIDPTEADIRCPRCDTPAKISYYGGIMRAHCPHCAEGIDRERERNEVSGDHPARPPFIGLSIPPTGLAGADPADLFRRAFVFYNSQIRTHLSGVCPTCARDVDLSIYNQGEVAPTTGHSKPVRPDPLALVRTVCSTCKTHVTIPVRRAIQIQPAVVAFYHDHGIENRFVSWSAYRRSWTYDEEILSEDPVRVRVTIPCDNDRLRLTVNEELTITDERRQPA